MTIRVFLALGAIACAAWLALAGYSIGLDFRGGASIEVRPRGDATRVVGEALAARPSAEVHAAGERVVIELDGGDESDVAAISQAVGADGQVESATIVPSTFPAWQGRPLACALALVAAIAWLGTLVWRRSWALALVGTLTLTAAASVLLLLARGATLTLPVQLTGALLGVATMPAARPGEGASIARITGVWPVAVAFAIIVVGTVLVRHPKPNALFQYALYFAPSALPAAVVIATLSVLAATGTGVPAQTRA